jgi:AraC family transcriptional regulator of adaptative response / DNA-3-methyladenine glycosylase II
MELDHNTCYRALRTRDSRFDGRFFTGVHSTGIYCRPICPARTPKQSNVDFYACAAAAEDAGFRPCRRCRPETSPGTPAWLGTSTTVTRARTGCCAPEVKESVLPGRALLRFALFRRQSSKSESALTEPVV